MSEAFPALSRLVKAKLIPADPASRGRDATVWDVHFPRMLLELKVPAPVDHAQLCDIEVQLGNQSIRHSGVVQGISKSLSGSQIIAIDLARTSASKQTWQQRRANDRYTCHKVFAAHCAINHPLQQNLPVRSIVRDLSFGGARLELESADPAFQPGLTLNCTLSLPCSENIELRLRICDVSSADLDQPTTLHCSLVESTDRKSQIIAEYVVRFGQSDEILALLQSHSIQGDVSRLVSFSLESSPRFFNSLCRNLGSLADASAPKSDDVTYAAVRLGSLPIAAIKVCTSEDEPCALRVLELIHRPEVFELRGVARLILDFIDTVRTSCEAQETIGCVSWEGFVSKTPNKSRRWPIERLHNSVSWSNYAISYDVMCRVNPAYSENLKMFRDWLTRYNQASSPIVLDLGAGTGNYIIETSKVLPRARIFHLERDPVMNRLASAKYKQADVNNVSFVLGDIDQLPLENSWVDIVIMVNTLYSLPEPHGTLTRVFSTLKPGGLFFLIDLGREMDVKDWSKYIASSSIQANGVLHTIESFYRGRHAITQNRAIRFAQDNGRFWKHSPAELAVELNSIGFEILEARECYRGYCDNAICKKPVVGTN